MLSRDFLNPRRIQTALSEIAHYLTVREQTDALQFGAIFGVTHKRLARLAVNHFSFERIDTCPTTEATELPAHDLDDQPRIVHLAHALHMPFARFRATFQEGHPTYRAEMLARTYSLLDGNQSLESQDIKQAATQAVRDAIQARVDVMDPPCVDLIPIERI